jgi:hypothetical protein
MPVQGDLPKGTTDSASQPGAPDVVKVSANLPREDLELLRTLAADRGVTMTDVLKEAIRLEAFLSTQEKLLVEGPDQKLSVVLRPHLRRAAKR